MNPLSIKGLAIGLAIGLIAGLATGYIFVTVLTLRVVQLEAEIAERDAKISDLSTQLGDKSGEVIDLQKRIEELEAKIGESEKPEDVSPSPPSPLISSKYPAKTVTWADGTSETIQVGDKGKIYLNGEEVKAFGFNIGRIKRYGIATDEMVDKILDWLQAKGVRFMNLGYSRSEAGWPDYIGVWMRQLYAHKMFVHFTSHWKSDSVDVATQYNWFKESIDKINALPQKYVDGIYAVGLPCWEMNMFFDYDTLDRYLTELYPLCRDYLRASKIGNVPLTGKTSHEMWNDGGIAIVKHSDIPSWDFYPRAENWKGDVDWCMNKVRTEVLPRAGKTGYQIWLTEHGYGKELPELGTWGSGTPHVHPPELLDYVLSIPEISSMSLWALQYYDGDPVNDWGAFFQHTGEPKQWTSNLAPHFPKYQT